MKGSVIFFFFLLSHFYLSFLKCQRTCHVVILVSVCFGRICNSFATIKSKYPFFCFNVAFWILKNEHLIFNSLLTSFFFTLLINFKSFANTDVVFIGLLLKMKIVHWYVQPFWRSYLIHRFKKQCDNSYST